MSGPRIVSDGFLSREELRDRRVLVLGLGMSGLAVTRALASAGAEVFASDSRSEVAGDPQVIALRESGIRVETGTHRQAEKWLASADMIVPSPGISPRSRILGKAISDGVPVLSEIELAYRFVSSPIVAVTGTNGKTTTSRLIGRMLADDGVEAVVCGNIGHPFITAAMDSPSAKVFVVEVSSFQLTFCYAFHPTVAVITNFAPDHIDWHGSIESYRSAKARIASRQTRGDWYVYPAYQPELSQLVPSPGPHLIPFSSEVIRTGDGVWVDHDEVAARVGSSLTRRLGRTDNLARFGKPFVEDGLAATAAALAMSTSPEAIERSLAQFEPDEHRIEPVAELEGVRFIDDSKATNPHATVAALRNFSSVVLIAGGRSKGLDLSEIGQESGRTKAVVAMGEAAAELEKVFSAKGVPVSRAGTISEAVEKAASLAQAGDVVLLSPGCSSHDQYANYAERGEAFQEAAQALVDRRTQGASS